MWIANEKFLELSRFEPELHLSKASIETACPGRGSIVKPSLELWAFSTFFHWCCISIGADSQI